MKFITHPRKRIIGIYYFLLTIILTIAVTVSGTIRYSSRLKTALVDTSQEVIQDFPIDLELSISPNGIIANKDFPLVAKSPKILKGMGENLVIIDPNGEVAMLERYQASVLINNSYVIVGSGDTVQTTPLKDFPTVEINYATMQSISNNLLSAARNSAVLTAGFFAIANLLNFFVARLIYLVFFAFILRLVYRSLLVDFTRAFAVSVYTVTVPLLISTLLAILDLTMPFSGWFTFLHLIITLYLLKRLEKTARN